jgi:parallel beta-helix repeat protein
VGIGQTIRILNRNNITIANTRFVNSDTSILVDSSSNITIIQNTFENSEPHSIYMTSSNNCSIIGNNIVDSPGDGLFLTSSSYLNIAYNNISRNQNYGGTLTISNSNISRNNIADNNHPVFANGIGFYLYGSNSHNSIFENNFIGNRIGLFYQGGANISLNNLVYSNYWNNTNEQIVNLAGDPNSGIDQSPLESPISNSYEPIVISSPASPTPTPTQTPQPSPTPNSLPSQSALPTPTPNNSPTQQPSSTTLAPTPSVPEFSFGVALLLVIMTTLICIRFRRKKPHAPTWGKK